MRKPNINTFPIKKFSFYIGSALLSIFIILIFLNAGKERTIPEISGIPAPTPIAVSYPYPTYTGEFPMSVGTGFPVNQSIPQSPEVQKLFSVVPEIQNNFYIYYNFPNNTFELVLNIGNPDQGLKDFDIFLKKNGIAEISLIKNLEVQKNINIVFKDPSFIPNDNLNPLDLKPYSKEEKDSTPWLKKLFSQLPYKGNNFLFYLEGEYLVLLINKNKYEDSMREFNDYLNLQGFSNLNRERFFVIRAVDSIPDAPTPVP